MASHKFDPTQTAGIRAVVRPDQFPLNQELLQLSVAGEQYWDEAWSKFKAG